MPFWKQLDHSFPIGHNENKIKKTVKDPTRIEEDFFETLPDHTLDYEHRFTE